MGKDFKDGCWLFGVVDAFNSPFGGIFVRRGVVEGSPRLLGSRAKVACMFVNSPAPPTSPDRRPSGRRI